MCNLFYDIAKFIEYITLTKRERSIKKKVPNNCFYCELLGICRDENNGWKCRHGCMIINFERDIPYTCEKCELLYKCRDRYNNYKCRNGCIILNDQRQKEIEDLYK